MRIIILTLMLLMILYPAKTQAEEIPDFEKLVNSIYKAEGGEKATYLYGIKSVPYKDEAEARQICFNTVRNQWRRHNNHSCGKDYLVCLRDRYCPLEAHKLNRHWLRNVKYFLGKSEVR